MYIFFKPLNMCLSAHINKTHKIKQLTGQSFAFHRQAYQLTYIHISHTHTHTDGDSLTTYQCTHKIGNDIAKKGNFNHQYRHMGPKQILETTPPPNHRKNKIEPFGYDQVNSVQSRVITCTTEKERRKTEERTTQGPYRKVKQPQSYDTILVMAKHMINCPKDSRKHKHRKL